MPRSITVALALVLAVTATAQMKKNPDPASGVRRAPLQSSAAQTAAAQFPRVSQEDAMKLYREGKAVFIDVRSTSQFEAGHIKGALSIPGSQLVRRFKEVPVQKTVITYCACSEEQSSGRAAADLIAHGVKNVYALKGGWIEWSAADRPSASGK